MSAEELSWAVKNGDLSEVKKIFESSSGHTMSDASGRPLLCIAADFGQTSVIEYLLDRGADVNAQDKHGITPLLSAIFEGHTAAVKLLLERGANKNLKAPSGESYYDSAETEEIRNLLK